MLAYLVPIACEFMTRGMPRPEDVSRDHIDATTPMLHVVPTVASIAARRVASFGVNSDKFVARQSEMLT